MSLIPISLPSQQTSSPPPLLILIHDISGSIFPYIPLGLHPALEEYAIYGIAYSESTDDLGPPPHTPGSSSDHHDHHHAAASPFPYETITEWARAYTALMQRELEEELRTCGGRVVLGGWSLGGVLAAEMARIFAATARCSGSSGEGLELEVRVEGLILIDSYAPWSIFEHDPPATLSDSDSPAPPPEPNSESDSLLQSDHISPPEMRSVYALLRRTGREEWNGLSRTSSGGGYDKADSGVEGAAPAYLITPSRRGANGLEEWFHDEHEHEHMVVDPSKPNAKPNANAKPKGTILRIAQHSTHSDSDSNPNSSSPDTKTVCDHFTMMSAPWVEEVAERVGEAMVGIVGGMLVG